MSNSIGTALAMGVFAVVMVIPSVMTVSKASIENNSDVSSNGFILPSGSSTHFPVGSAIEHINQAQAALQNGDTETANNHLELAKQSLGKAVPDEQGFIGSGRTDEIPVPDN